MNRTAADDLTVAYIAIGAARALDAERGGREGLVNQLGRIERVIEEHEGELGLIQDAIKHAITLDRMGDEVDNEFTGVFAYEVAEEFGRRYVVALLEARDVSPESIMREVIASAT